MMKRILWQDRKAAKDREREDNIREQDIVNLSGTRHLEAQKLKSILAERGMAIFEVLLLIYILIKFMSSFIMINMYIKLLISVYMHMALVGVRDGFISAQVSESSPSLKGECRIQIRVLR